METVNNISGIRTWECTKKATGVNVLGHQSHGFGTNGAQTYVEDPT